MYQTDRLHNICKFAAQSHNKPMKIAKENICENVSLANSLGF